MLFPFYISCPWPLLLYSASTAVMCTRPFCPLSIAGATGCCRWVTDWLADWVRARQKDRAHPQNIFLATWQCPSLSLPICISNAHFYCGCCVQNPDIVLVHYLNVPYPDDNKMAVIAPSLALWGDKKEWTKEELVSQLKPMCKEITINIYGVGANRHRPRNRSII